MTVQCKANTPKELEMIEEAVASKDYSGVQHLKEDKVAGGRNTFELNEATIEETKEFMRNLISKMSVENIAVKGGKVEFVLGGLIFDLMIEKKKIDGREEEFFNASDFVKKYNEEMGTKKRINKWAISKRFKEIVELWEHQKSVPKNKIYRKERVGKVDKIKVHKDLFFSLCIWLDAKYEVAITDFLNNVTSGVSLVKMEREKEKSANISLNDSLKMLDDMLKKERSRFRAFNTVNNWVNEFTTDGAIKSGLINHDTELYGVEIPSRGQVAHNVDVLIVDGLLDSSMSGRDIVAGIRTFFGKKKSR